ncbi:MAG: ABC transporter permease [Alloprevotella sp.]
MKRFFMHILRVWHQELATALHDKGILIFIVFVPLAYPLLYAFVYTNEVVREVPVVVVDDARSAQSREFVRQIDATAEVCFLKQCHSMAEAEHYLKTQEAYGIIHIPSSFDRDLSLGNQTTVGLYSDMCSLLYYKAMLLAANNVALTMNKDIKTTRYIKGTTERQDEVNKTPIDYDYVPLYNPQSGFAAFLIPPVLMLIIQQTLLLGIGMSAGHCRERNHGSLLPLGRTFSHPLQVALGRGSFYFLLYMMWGLYMFVVVTPMFGLPALGHFHVFVAFLIPFILACVALALAASALVYRREDCIMLFVFLSVPLLFLSGVSWPAAVMPRFWQYVSYLFPSTFGMNGYARITGCGASLTDVAFEWRGLWVQAIVYTTVACLIYRRQMKKRPM